MKIPLAHVITRAMRAVIRKISCSVKVPEMCSLEALTVLAIAT